MKLFHLTTRHLRGDLFGGVTAGIVALPLALAFGVQSGMGAIAGLYGAIALGIFAAFFGGTNTQVSGPTGPMTVVSSAVILQASGWGTDPAVTITLIMACFVLSGALQIGFGLLRIGTYIKFIPYPVVSGFMSGIGVIIILLQLFPMIGHASPGRITDVFVQFPGALQDINMQALMLTAVTIFTIYMFPRVTRVIPSPLVALVTGVIIALVAKLDVPLIGEIPEGLPALNLDVFSAEVLGSLQLIIIPAVTLAALGAIDSLLTSVVADNVTRTKHESNRELIGQGIGNMISGLIGGIPGAGATMRTMVNIKAGGKTRLSGMIHGFLLLAILLGLGRYASLIPLSVLAGILITVGISIIDYKGLRHIRTIPRTDAVIMIMVLILTVFIDLLIAVGIGMVMAALLFMKKMSDITDKHTNFGLLSEIDRELPWDDERNLDAEITSRIYIKHLYGPLFFGYAGRFKELSSLVKDVELVIIRMGRVPYIDQSGLYALQDAIQDLRKKGTRVMITGLKGQPLDMLKRMDIIPALVEEEMVFSRFNSAVKWMKQNMKNNN